MRGRYPLGCVAPGAEYERVRDEIHAGLTALHDEHGHRVFRGVWRREELYRGPFVPEAPDIVLECTPRFGVLFESLRREIRSPDLFGPFEELGYTGTHDPDGLYVFAGGPFAACGRGETLPIEAVASTVLYGLGVAIPRDFEARRHGRRRPPTSPPQYQEPTSMHAGAADAGWQSGADEEQVAEHLRALGYLE